jgi:competence protein ComEA
MAPTTGQCAPYKEVTMNKLLKSLLLVISMSVLSAGAAHAKAEPQKASMSASAKATASTPAATPAVPAEKAALLDINSASKKELSELPKIGDVRSNAIIKGRPYTGKDELLSRKILPQAVYDGIKDLVVAKQKTVEEKKK